MKRYKTMTLKMVLVNMGFVDPGDPPTINRNSGSLTPIQMMTEETCYNTAENFLRHSIIITRLIACLLVKLQPIEHNSLRIPSSGN